MWDTARGRNPDSGEEDQLLRHSFLVEDPADHRLIPACPLEPRDQRFASLLGREVVDVAGYLVVLLKRQLRNRGLHLFP